MIDRDQPLYSPSCYTISHALSVKRCTVIYSSYSMCHVYTNAVKQCLSAGWANVQ